MDDAYLRHLPPPDLSGMPSSSNLPSSTPAERSSTVEPWAVEEATFFVGLFQKDDAYDPITYSLAITSLFSMYPQEIVHRATGLNGLVAVHDSSWLPSIARVRQYLEEEVRPLREAEAWRARVAVQLAERREWERPLSEEAAARRKALADAWFERSAKVHEESAEERRRAGLEQIERVNREAFERECRAEGVDPASSVASPSLRKLLSPS